MKKYLLIGVICLFGISDCFASSSSALMVKNTCNSLGYGLASPSTCKGRYFTCPLGGYYKCDNTARVGDLKYSSATGDHKGWLLCDGRALSSLGTEYTSGKLATLLSSRGFGSYLPNYRGRYFRGYGSVTGYSSRYTSGSYASTQFDDLRSHTHDLTVYGSYYSRSDLNQGILGGAWDPKCMNASLTVSIDSAGTITCPVSLALNVFIYSGL